MNNSAAHSQLVEDILVKIGSLPYVRAWKRHVGLFYIVRFDKQTRKVNYVQPIEIGINGEPDVQGIMRLVSGVGVMFGVESKTGAAGQNDDQKRYQKMIERMGGVYILARSADDALNQIHAAREKKKETSPLPGLLETAHEQAEPGDGSGADVR